MTTAEIITIGTAILLGELIDTNAQYIARQLRDLGIDIYRKTSVGDNKHRIAQAVQQALERSNIVITTGGLGPTVDDPTREAVALAMNVDVIFIPELWDQIVARFKRFGRQPTENNRRQAFIPKGATPIENPVGTAPAFVYEIPEHAVISLPGVPREMEYLIENAVLPYIRNRFPQSGIIKSRILHTAGVGESQIDEIISELETLSNPTVGLAAHSGQVDIRITAKASTLDEANQMILRIEMQLRELLGSWVYGADSETLEHSALQALRKNNWSLALIESGLGGELIRKLASEEGPFVGGELLATPPDPATLTNLTNEYRESRSADVGLGVMLIPGSEKQDVLIVLITSQGIQEISRPYGGPPQLAPRWAANHSLNLIRQL
jgi:nicotinamide-nucleotide amidase